MPSTLVYHKPPCLAALIRVVAVFVLMGVVTAAPAQAPGLPTVASLKLAQEALAGRNLPEAELAAARQNLEQAQQHLAQAEASERQRGELARLLEEAPALAAQARRELRRLEAAPERRLQVDASGDPAALEKRFEEQTARLEELQRALADANSLILGAQTRPDQAPVEIQAAQARLAQIGELLRSGRESGRSLAAERRDALATEARALEAAIELRRAQLAGNAQLQQLGQARRDLLLVQIARQEREVHALRSAINEGRRARSEQTVADLADEFRRGAAGTGRGGLLARETEVNRQLSEFLLRTTDRLNDLTQRNLQARQQLDALSQAERTLAEQISVLQGSLLLTRILYEQKRALPSLRLDPDLPDQIADLRLYQFEINRHREQLADPAAYVDRLVAQEPADTVTDVQRRELQALLETRATLLERLNRELGALLNESYGLQLNQRQLQATADQLRKTLDEQMFWVPSNRPLDLEWFQGLPGRLERQAVSVDWPAGGRDLAAAFAARPGIWFAVIVVLAIALLQRGALRRRLDALHLAVAEGQGARQWSTPHALLLSLLRALPGPLLLGIASAALRWDGRGLNGDLAAALLAIAAAWLAFGFGRQVLAAAGVAERHFGWSPAALVPLRRDFSRLGWIVALLAGVAAFGGRRPAALHEDAVGVLLVLAGHVAMAWLLARIALRRRPVAAPSWRMLLGGLFAVLPLALVAALFLGYHFTVLKLTERFIGTLYVLLGWQLLHALAVRSLQVAARRLAGQQDNLARSNRQSLRLVRLVLLGGLVLVLYLVWADLIPLLSYLDNFALYEYASGSGDKAVMVPISLRDLLVAGGIVAGTVALARNLPGLLDVLLLSRLSLAQGSAYAVTTLVSYVIAGVGVVSTLSTLGVSWDKLQWLVAALSVGLGFGLQEIFANFISGLIILFERPVRIGDVVTIGNLSGTVSRIRIRATTITDFDRKEIIVPNKTFVTDQLINWTLSDTVTRVTISLGVAYGSDLEQVRRLLLEIAKSNPRVLADPAPQVVFQSFGASTLDHELRVHVRELIDRAAAIDEINRRIAVVFREQGIEIAFGQVDVHIRSFAGPEVLLQRAGGAGSTPGAAPAAGPGPAGGPAPQA